AGVDADDAIAERILQLNGVVPESAGGADDRNRTAGEDVVLPELLHRAVRRESATRERRLLVAHAVGQHDQRLRVHREILRERPDDSLRLRAVARLAAQAELAGTAPVAA